MAIKFTRSTSFFTVDLQESLETLLQKALRRRAKYVIVNARRGPEVSFYVWERRTFANALQQVQQDAKELVPADAGRITLRQLLVNKLDQLVELETTAGSLDLISKEIEMFIKKGNPVVHLQENEPRAILLPTKSAFPKVSTRMSLDFGRLSHLLLRDYVELQEMDRARCADPCPPNVGEGWQFDTFDMVYDVPPTEGAAPQEAAGGGGPPEGNGGRGGEGPGGSDSGGNPPPGEPPAYPNLKVSDEHPIQDTTINIEVSIDFEKPKHTTGVVTLPSDDREYTLDVHLLVEKESRWERLKFKRPEGTTQPAIFKGVTVPMIPVIQRHAEERLACDIYVNFYLLQPYEKADGTPVRNARWCGEAVRRIEILAREELSPTKIEPPKQVEWRKYLHVSPTSPPPDFLVRIKKLRDREFQWTVLSPHRDFTGLPADELNSTLSASPYAFMQDHFEKFAGKPLDEAKIRKLDGLCDVIYESTPAGFRKAYWDLYLGTGQDPQRRAALESIQFVSDEPFIPWELMRLSDDERAPNVAPEILAVRHAVGRWVALDSVELRQALRVKEIAVFATDYNLVASVTKKLKWAIEELKNLVSKFKAKEYRVLETPVRDFLEKGTAQLVHFSCHGRMNVQEPENAVIQLEDALLEAPTVWGPESRRGIGLQRPLVFLNACQTGAAGEVIGLVFGWPQTFLRMGATACIAPLWSVVDDSAKDVAAAFYDLVLKDTTAYPEDKPVTLGEALRQIRSTWREKKSLTYLGYVLYGDPTTTLEWRNPI